MLAASILALAAIATASPLKDISKVSGVGNVYVFNKCPYPVNIWLNSQGQFSAMTTIDSGKNWGESFDPSSSTGTKTVTIMTSGAGISSQDAKLVLGYTYVPTQNTVWYDLYTFGGTPFQGSRVLEKSAEPTCAANDWPNGVPTPGSHVKQCRSDRDVELWLCN
jgi:hypothetical protein